MGTSVLLTLWGAKNKPPPRGCFYWPMPLPTPLLPLRAPPLVWMTIR